MRLYEYLKRDSKNYHSEVKLKSLYQGCEDELIRLVNEGLIVKRNGLNNPLYKAV